MLFDARVAFQRWVTPLEGEKQQQREEAAKRFNELATYYNHHAVWLGSDSRQKLESILDSLCDVFGDFRGFPESGASTYDIFWYEPQDQHKREVRHQVTMRVLKEIPDLMNQLDEEFQVVLYPRSWWRRMFGG
jgi:hypothetical protein